MNNTYSCSVYIIFGIAKGLINQKKALKYRTFKFLSKKYSYTNIVIVQHFGGYIPQNVRQNTDTVPRQTG